jgi:hypothetical protein
MVIVASSEFLKKNGKTLKGEDYIHFQRTDLNALQEDMVLKLNPRLIFSDPASPMSLSKKGPLVLR